MFIATEASTHLGLALVTTIINSKLKYKYNSIAMRCLLFLICVSFSFSGYGQKMNIGFRGGANFSNFLDHYSAGEIPDYSIGTSVPNNPIIICPCEDNSLPNYYYKTDFIKDIRIGFYSYLFLDISLKDRLSVELGLGYSQKEIDMKYNYYSTTINSDNSTTELSYKFNRNLRLDYIVAPVTFQYMIDKKQRFYILGGVYNSFAVNFLIKNSLVITNKKTYDSSGQLSKEEEGKTADPKTYAKIFDAGLIGGVGVNFPLTEKMTIGLDLRAAVGLVNIPGKYEQHGFQSFSESTKNLSFETGLKLLYALKE